VTREELIDQLRDALNHLYDPERLRRNGLAARFGVANRFDTATALQRILIDAIASLKPAPGEPPQSPAWQVYEPLFYRYVEQLSSDEVADQLGIGTRHLRRWQTTALAALAELLWKQFGFTDWPAAEPAEGPAAAAGQSAAGLRQELAWLREASGADLTDLAESLPAILNLAHKLAVRHSVTLNVTQAASGLNRMPRVSLPPVALRQTLINLFSVAIPRAAGGCVEVSVAQVAWDVLIGIRCPHYPSGPRPPLEDEADNLNMARQLAEVCGCWLNLAADARGFDAMLTLPALEQIPILVIDDKPDTLQLLQRYASGSRYRLITVSDGEQAVETALRVTPQVIVLDVMMPRVDGWELIGRLHENPKTQDVPIIVHTILAQRDLALLLGANDYMRKPVSRPDFLAALDRQLGLAASTPR
jgi:CheY-like chemotaxis protein